MNDSLQPKDTNPKDAIGATKLPMHLVPSSVMTYASLAFLEGALKYGKYNWRVAGVRASIYIDAMHRHLHKFQNGEWADPETNVPHLASIIACAGILLDARECGKLTDDRPPAVDYRLAIDSLMPVIEDLKQLHSDRNPYHYTIEDTEREKADT
jgi:hypothetical protein